jgi:hypothetical protein
MNENNVRSRGKSQRPDASHRIDGRIQYALNSEEHLLQSISSRLPLPRILNEICSVLDRQIGNVVSLISLPGENAGEPGAIAGNAVQFGLCLFCREEVLGENDEVLGILEMYSCVERGPDEGEIQLIERAKCLAAIAIKHVNEAGEEVHCVVEGNRPAQGRILAWPDSMS